MTAPLPPFQITFVQLSGRALPVAELASPLLDPAMHEDGRVRIGLGRMSMNQLVVDEFQMDSLLAYVSNQAKIRQALERVLDEHHAGWDTKKRFGRGPAVWTGVKIGFVSFAPRAASSPDSLKKAWDVIGGDYTEAEVEKYQNRPDTASRFTLGLEGDWSDGHGRMVDFRDCEVVEFILDG
jgi:hypothetical protein